MIRVLTSLKLKKDFDRIKVYTNVHLGFVCLATIVEVFHTGLGFSELISYGYLVFLYAMFWRMLKELYYTFWSIIGLLFLYNLSGMIGGFSTLSLPFAGYCYGLSIVFLFIQSYTLLSPVYYPIVNWWEYDFRYRDDVKVNCDQFEGESFEGRLTDLRRGAGCLTAFCDLGIGDNVTVKIIEEGSPVQFKAEVMSRRVYSLGRPINYGVKFHFKTAEEKESFESFCLHWRTMRSSLRQLKFKQSK